MKRTIKYPNLQKTDPEIAKFNRLEEERQFWDADFIASENYASPAVREASSSVATNKYSEGYPGARYYKGSEVAIDPIEIRAQERALKLFGADENVWGANVQPASGSEANLAVYGGLLKHKGHADGEDIALGMRLDFGGHLTHGFYVSFSGKLFHFEQYGLDNKGYIDYAQVEELSEKFKPKLIVCGASAYSRTIDFELFGKIAKKHNALLMADIAHIAGLIAGSAHPSPFPHCDIVTTTTHKTLRGPRGAIIFARKDVATLPPTSPPAPLSPRSLGEAGLRKERGAPPPTLLKLINSAVFPGLQGGPHNQQTMAIAVCLKEANTPQFRAYAKSIVKNAQTLSDALDGYGFDIISGGTDNHLMLVDLRPFNVTGEDASSWLSRAGIITNKNAIPNDPLPPKMASGIRLGTPAVTTRGMGTREMRTFAKWIYEAIANPSEENLSNIKKQVRALCKKFPPPGFEV